MSIALICAAVGGIVVGAIVAVFVIMYLLGGGGYRG